MALHVDKPRADPWWQIIHESSDEVEKPVDNVVRNGAILEVTDRPSVHEQLVEIHRCTSLTSRDVPAAEGKPTTLLIPG